MLIEKPWSERKNARADTTLCIILAAYFLFTMMYLRLTPTMVYVDFGIKLSIPILLVTAFRIHPLPATARTIMVLYVVLAAYTFLVSMTSEAPQLEVLNTAKYMYPLLFLLALFLILNPKTLSLRFLAVIPYLGALLAVQTIFVFISVQSGHAPPNQIIVLSAYKSMPYRNYGLLGFAEATRAAGTNLQVYRAQSFFLEPTRLACFLESAIILGYGLYSGKHRKRMLVCMLLSAVAFIITFSTTGYIAMFVTGIVFVFSKYGRRLGQIAPIAWVAAALVALACVYWYLVRIDTFYISGASVLNEAFGKSFTDVSHRLGSVQDSIRLVYDHPLGIGVISNEQSALIQNYLAAGDVIAPLHWLRIAGVLGVTLQLIVITTMLRMAIRYIPAGGIESYVGLAFVANVVHHMVAGDWFDAKFFFLLACLVVMDAQRNLVAVSRRRAALSMAERGRRPRLVVANGVPEVSNGLET